MIRRCAGPLVIGLAGLPMLVWQWRFRPDVLIDFGRELYVPWRLTQGQVLYTDIAYFNGPLSAYFNSLGFRLFGVSILTLSLLNTVIAAVLVVLLYHMLRQIADRVSATCACVTFEMIFGFSNLVPAANYNFITPYSHEVTHGVVLVLAAIWCISMVCLRGGGMIYWASAGFALGLAFLAKAEVFVAGLLAVGVAVGLTIRWRSSDGRSGPRHLGVLLAMTALPVLASFGSLSTAMSPAEAWRGTIGTWSWLGTSEVTSLKYYRRSMGLDQLTANLQKMFVAVGWYAVIFLPPGLLGLWLGKNRLSRMPMAVACFAVTIALLGWNVRDIAWVNAARPLPLFMVAMVAAVLVAFVKQRTAGGPSTTCGSAQGIVQLSLALCALGLLGKMFFNARAYHYGFALAMPASLLVVVALTCWLPNWIERRGGYGGALRAVALGALLICILGHLQLAGRMLSYKTETVSSGPDRFYADRRGKAVNLLLDDIERHINPDQTLIVLPEGVMVNYLSRRVNPTPYINFMPPEVLMFGEQNMLAAFQEQRPDFIAIVHKNTAEYGVRFFGHDYGRDLYGWIAANYEPVDLIGAVPLRDNRFGILLLQAKDS